MELQKNLDAILITNPINIRYLTGFVGVSPEEREAQILLTQDVLILFTSALYIESTKNAKCQIPNIQLKVVEISRDEPLSKKLVTVLNEKQIKRLGFEEVDLTVAEFQKLKQTLKDVTLVPTRNRIEESRMIKRDDEIENIRKAAALTDKCFTYLTSFLKPGVTESQTAWEIESFFRKAGAQISFSPIVAFGSNSSMPHYASTNNTQLTTNNLILLDFGARVNGYCSDMTRVVFVGEPKDEWERAYETVLAAQTAALTNIRNNPDKLAREVIKNAGFPIYPHSLGHGVGLAIHEQPRLSYKWKIKLLPGMVVTIEPAIYKEESYGIRIEDLVLLEEDGIEILSKSPKKLFIL